ncbi:ESPL1 protein, partial [Pedionomus torquatus]|nr:ESPL1 protein [Pedionomus torquatus]
FFFFSSSLSSGVTICLLTLASVWPGSVGDTLLLLRLERDILPVTIPIPTAHGKVSLSSVLRDFDTILKGQKEANACRDKQDWWLHRSQLEQEMKNLIENLERHVLGCWRGALLPSAPPQSGLEEEAALLHPQLLACGWKDP